jgi:hypothetical protein
MHMGACSVRTLGEPPSRRFGRQWQVIFCSFGEGAFLLAAPWVICFRDRTFKVVTE